jgi:hypothetical protein
MDAEHSVPQSSIPMTGPETEVQTILPNHELPGGLLTLRDPRGWNETPLWLPKHRTLVFADALTERAGVLRVWMSTTHEDRALPDLRAMLDLQFEHVIISHGEPVHTRHAFERAPELPQWPAGPLHQVAYRGNLERARSLVEAGADVTVRDERFGATALDWAGWTKQDAVVVYLKSVMKEADHSGNGWDVLTTDGPRIGAPPCTRLDPFELGRRKV